MWSGNSVDYYGSVFPLRNYGSDTRGSEGNGTFRGADGIICNRNRRHKDHLDLWIFPASQIPAFPVYLLSRILDYYNYYAGNMFLFHEETVRPAAEVGRKLFERDMIKIFTDRIREYAYLREVKIIRRVYG